MKLIDLTSNCPTQQGIVLHTLVFFVITYLSMRKSKSDIRQCTSMYVNSKQIYPCEGALM